MFEALCELEVLVRGLRGGAHDQGGARGAAEDPPLAASSGAAAATRSATTRSTSSSTPPIYAGSHNAYLARLTAETRARIAPFSRAQFRTFGRLAQSHAEHERVVAAILQGDRDAAAAEMRAHIGYVHEAYAGYRP